MDQAGGVRGHGPQGVGTSSLGGGATGASTLSFVDSIALDMLTIIDGKLDNILVMLTGTSNMPESNIPQPTTMPFGRPIDTAKLPATTIAGTAQRTRRG